MVSVTNAEGCDPDGWLVGVNRQGHANADDHPVEILVGFESIVTGAEAGPEGLGTIGDKREGDIRSSNCGGWQRPIARIEFEPRKAKELRDPIVMISNPWRAEFDDYGSKLLEEDKPIGFEHQRSYFAYYSNREEGAYKAQGMQDSAYAGLWYIALNLDGREANGTNIDQNNYTLTVKLDGEEVEGQAWRPSNKPGPEPSAEPMNSAEGGESGDKNSASQADGVGEKGSLPLEDKGTNWTTIGLVGLAAVLIMGAVVVMVAKNSRKKKQGPAQNQHFSQP